MLGYLVGLAGLIPIALKKKYIDAPTDNSLSDINEFILSDYEHNTQRDNLYKPSAACNVTAVWVSKQKKLIKCNLKDDDLMAFLNCKNIERKIREYKWSYGFRGLINSHKSEKIWRVLAWLCNIIEFCPIDKIYSIIKSAHKMPYPLLSNMIDDIIKNSNESVEKYIFGYLTLDDLIDELIGNNEPVIIGGKFTRSGHYVALVGFNRKPDGRVDFICHDSWGDANTGYREKNGAFVNYSGNYLYNTLHHDGQKINNKRAFRTIAKG